MGPGFGCVGDPGGTLGFKFGVFGGKGFVDGGVGISGGEFGIDGDEGGGGVCCVQPTVIALSMMAARVDLVAFIFALLISWVLSAKVRVSKFVSHTKTSRLFVGQMELLQHGGNAENRHR